MKKITLLLLVILLLQSCGYSDHPASSYSKRLSNVLDVDLSISELEYPMFPPTSVLQISPPENVISIREFLGVRECEIHQHIALRNSQIGRVASSSQVLLNDLAILATIEPCITSLEPGDLRDKLVAYHHSKEEFLPTRLWHAVLAGDEYRRFWFPRKIDLNYPELLPTQNIEGSLTSLTSFIDTAIAQDFTTVHKLEEDLGNLRFGDAGQVLYELMYIQSHLEAADKIVDERLQNKLCASNTPTPKAHHFANVVTLFFIKEVQPRTVDLIRRLNVLLPLIDALEAPLRAHQNENYTKWQSQRTERIAQAVDATKNHSIKLNMLYKQCGLLPGSSQH